MDAGLELAVRNLEKFQNSRFPILTIYLSSNSKEAPSSKFLLSQLHSLIHKNLSREEQKIFKKDIEKIEKYLTSQYDKRGKHALVFFSSGGNLWEVLDFDYYLPVLCLVSYSPYLNQINETLSWSKI